MIVIMFYQWIMFILKNIQMNKTEYKTLDVRINGVRKEKITFIKYKDKRKLLR